MQSSHVISRRAQRGTTCHHCRRMKLRCDASSQFPAPCTRCAKAERVCSLGMPTREREHSEDPSHRITQLEKDLRDLRQSLQSSSRWTPATSRNEQDGSTESFLTAAQLATELDVEVPPLTLGDVEILPHDLLNLIDIFFAHFHPQLPFLPSKRALVKDCVACPLLSWAIVAVASRASSTIEVIRVRLVWPVRRLAAESILQPRSLPVIQALLLLCLWPMPYAALIDDPSWSFSGIAVHKALQLGLNRPFGLLLQQAKGDEDVARAMQSTWIACFITSQMLSDRFGIPALVSADPSIIAAPIPPILKAVAETARKDSIISSLLSQHKSNDEQMQFFPILKAFESELESLEIKFRECQSPLLHRLLSSIKLRLYSFTLPRCSSQPGNSRTNQDIPEESSENHLYIANYASKAFALAMHVINTSVDKHSNVESTQEHPSQSCASWTFMDLQSFVMAVFTVLQLARKHQNLFESVQVSNAIQQACSMLRSCSVIDGDHFYRVCDIISYLAEKRSTDTEAGEPTEEEDVAPTIRPSMGVGVAHDIVKEAKKRYRHRKRFPEEFPEVDANTNMNTFEAESVANSEDWLQAQLSQAMATDFSLMMWPSWYGGAGFENGD